MEGVLAREVLGGAQHVCYPSPSAPFTQASPPPAGGGARAVDRARGWLMFPAGLSLSGPMRTPTQTPFAALHTLALGDAVTLPDGRELTIRAVERALPEPVGSMAGWLLAGEVGPSATLIATPSSPDGAIVLYTPMESIPTYARTARTVCEGVVSYWAPHLPNLAGAMGELGYKVCALRGKIDPMVLIWRGRELVVFVKSATTTPDALRYWFLDRDSAATERDVARYASTVRSRVEAPSVAPVPEKQNLYRTFTR